VRNDEVGRIGVTTKVLGLWRMLAYLGGPVVRAEIVTAMT
jgi:hypothetical protein